VIWLDGIQGGDDPALYDPFQMDYQYNELGRIKTVGYPRIQGTYDFPAVYYEVQIKILEEEFGTPVETVPISSANELLAYLGEVESFSSTGTVEGITIITHGDNEGFYFGKLERGNVTGFTKTGKGSDTGFEYNRLGDLNFPKSTGV